MLVVLELYSQNLYFLWFRSLKLSDGVVDSLSNIVDVLVVQPAHGDSAGLEEIKVLLLLQELAHLRVEAGVREHTDLLSDVIPSARCAQFLQPLPESGSHGDDPFRHDLDAVLPLLVQGRVLKNNVYNSGSVSRWVGVHGSHQQSYLRLHVGHGSHIVDDNS